MKSKSLQNEEVTEYNKSRWEELAKANVSFSRPWLDLNRTSARQMLDPLGLLSDVERRKVLCLASGGGQQSIAFALLGAAVTVLDFCKTQLDRDREAALQYGLEVRPILGDMRDLSMLRGEDFDIVWQPPSINNVREAAKVIKEVAGVLKVGGHYKLEFANPFTKGMDERSWDGQGYPLNRRYIDGEEVEPDIAEWEVWDETGNCRHVRGPKQYRHTLSTIINSLAASGFVIQQFWEETGSGGSDCEPGTWEHFTSVAPATLGLWSRLI